MSRIYNTVSMNYTNPILKQSTYGDELELQTMVREEEHVNVTTPEQVVRPSIILLYHYIFQSFYIDYYLHL